MKNIHILPTDKPSRLHFDGKLFLSPNPQISNTINSIVEGRNTYVISDEEIKEGNWMIRANEQPIKVTKDFFWDFGVRYYKITLTTDQDLIKDGVQAIPDEFLEWFVKNPSCELVPIANEWKEKYKIIIPKEEPKQECKGSFKDCFKPLDECVCDTMKSKETLEEAAEKYKYNPKGNFCFTKGAKWQQNKIDIFNGRMEKERAENRAFLELHRQERSYSEEEVRKSLLEIVLVNPVHISLLKSGYGQFPDTFELTEKGVDYIVEQFKKK